MAERISARLTAAAGRKFGLTVGGAFVVLALVLWVWHRTVAVPRVFGVLGSLFIIGGLFFPTYMGPVERGWMKLAHLISKVTTPIFMGIVYFVVISPVGMFRRMLGKNALVRSAGGKGLSPQGYWFVRENGKTRGDLTRQF